MKIKLSLIQFGMTIFESAGFILDDGQAIHAFQKFAEGISKINANPMYGPSIVMSSLL